MADDKDDDDATEAAAPLDLDAQRLADIEAAWNESTEGADAGETEDAAPASGRSEAAARRARDQAGRFAEGERPGEDPATEAAAASGQGQQAVAPAAGELVPAGWQAASKALWGKPQISAAEWAQVKQEVSRREEAVNAGFARYAEINPIASYLDKQGEGKTVASTWRDYFQLEQAVLKNPEQGMAQIAHNLGAHTDHQKAQFFARLAANYGYGFGAQGQQEQQQPEPDPLLEAFNPLLTPLERRLAAIEQQSQAAEYQRQQAEAAQRAEADRQTVSFLSHYQRDPQYPYFNDVYPDLRDLYNAGKLRGCPDLKTAIEKGYGLACQMHPEIGPLYQKQQANQQAQSRRQREQEVARQARQASRSVVGSAPGTPARLRPASPVNGRTGLDTDRRSDVEAAWDEINGAG